MSDDKMVVRIELRRAVAEKLRAMCHKRGETASVVIDRWIVEADERGEIKPAAQQSRATNDFLDNLFKQGTPWVRR